jgi:hypothetical protein
VGSSILFRCEKRKCQDRILSPEIISFRNKGRNQDILKWKKPKIICFQLIYQKKKIFAKGSTLSKKMLKEEIFFFSFFFFIVVLGGGTLWHLQRFLQCIKYISSLNLETIRMEKRIT